MVANVRRLATLAMLVMVVPLRRLPWSREGVLRSPVVVGWCVDIAAGTEGHRTRTVPVLVGRFRGIHQQHRLAPPRGRRSSTIFCAAGHLEWRHTSTSELARAQTEV